VTPTEIAARAAALDWYHSIDLGGGVVTRGLFDTRATVDKVPLPASLAGKRCLDVGTWDGFWAFEFERRGADVTALDIESTADVDLPGPMRAQAVARGLVDPIGDGFAMAKRALGSGVAHVTGTIYDLDPEQLGRFDLVHAGDVLLHLRDPLGALEQMRRVTKGQALLSEVYEPTRRPGRKHEGLPAWYFGGGNAAWWRPSLDTLVQMVADAGFSDVEVVATYNLAARGTRSGYWRAVLRATP